METMDGHASHRPDTAPVDQKLEVVIIPVSDVDQANDWRLVQMTPPGSPCSVMFGRRVTSAVPGSLQGAFLVVDDRRRQISSDQELEDAESCPCKVN